MMESENNLVKKLIERVMRDGTSPWKKKTDEYLQMAGMSYENLQRLSKKAIKNKVYEYDTRKWRSKENL